MDISKIDFTKGDGTIPVIVQDSQTNQVLMLGYANDEAIQETNRTGKLTFLSRSKGRLWTKGEESGNFLHVDSLTLDCDKDTILAKVTPVGPVCHAGTDTCFGSANDAINTSFLHKLESLIASRKENVNDEKSYVSGLFIKGINKIAQKVGEEAVELVIEAKDDNAALFLGEAADLLFHYLILLQAKGYKLNDVVQVLEGRGK